MPKRKRNKPAPTSTVTPPAPTTPEPPAPTTPEPPKAADKKKRERRFYVVGFGEVHGGDYQRRDHFTCTVEEFDPETGYVYSADQQVFRGPKAFKDAHEFGKKSTKKTS